jgi:hypothetical protein
VPLSDRQWHDLAKFKCRYYFPEKKRGAMARGKCWDEQQRTKKFWQYRAPIIISLCALAASTYEIWLPIAQATARYVQEIARFF